MSGFSSDGFDVDALSDTANEVLEISGKVSTTPEPAPTPPTQTPPPPPPIEKPKHVLCKEEGNALFLAGDYGGSLRKYNDAIKEAERLCNPLPDSKTATTTDEDDEFQDAVASDNDDDDLPPKSQFLLGQRLVRAQRDWSTAKRGSQARKANRLRQRKEAEEQRKKTSEDDTTTIDNPHSDSEGEEEFGDNFEPPGGSPPLAKELATYHSNAAATLHYLGRFPECIANCDAAIAYDDKYLKAFVRRAKAKEKNLDQGDDDDDNETAASKGDVDGALSDVKSALAILNEKSARDKASVLLLATLTKDEARLQKAADLRVEKLKDETMGKLKDLGNSILGNFGLSLDNFKSTQGPDGGYSISFNQG
jgi:tetratricopeptide (TPR) repeat protein